MKISLSFENIEFCVLIPCYNNTPGLVQSVKSIFYHSPHFLVLIVDDGSAIPVDESSIGNYTNGMVKVLRSSPNEGITKALNKGLNWIVTNVNTPYVARLDCGDICQKNRFTRQISFLQRNLQIGLLGCWCHFKDEVSGQEFIYKGPELHKQIRKNMYFKNSFMHAGVVIRLTALDQTGFYPQNYEYVEDYALFWKLCNSTQVCIIQESLVNCMLNRGGISYKNKGKQLVGRLRVVWNIAPASIFKLVGIGKIFCLLLLPRALVLKLKVMAGKVQR